MFMAVMALLLLLCSYFAKSERVNCNKVETHLFARKQYLLYFPPFFFHIFNRIIWQNTFINYNPFRFA